MKRPFAATVWREGTWYVSQCLELDVASQGETEEEALSNLKEALELHFEPPQATRPPEVRMIEAEVGGGLSPCLSARSSGGLRQPASPKPVRKAATSSSRDARGRWSIPPSCQRNARFRSARYAVFSAKPTSVPMNGKIYSG